MATFGCGGASVHVVGLTQKTSDVVQLVGCRERTSEPSASAREATCAAILSPRPFLLPPSGPENPSALMPLALPPPSLVPSRRELKQVWPGKRNRSIPGGTTMRPFWRSRLGRTGTCRAPFLSDASCSCDATY
jgi:hypothetical protein